MVSNEQTHNHRLVSYAGAFSQSHSWQTNVPINLEEYGKLAKTTSGSLTDYSHNGAGLAVAIDPPIRDQQERDHLVLKNLGLVRRLCGRYRNSGEPIEDLIQVGSVRLLKAAARYDPELGNSFVAYAIPVIVGEIKNYFRDHGWAVKVPRKLQSQKFAVGRAVDALIQQFGRSPTVNEIAQATGFSEDEVYQSFEVEFYGKPVSLDIEYDSGESDGTSTVLDYVGTVDPELEALPNRLDLARALYCLDEREKAIIYLYYYKDLSQTEIAKKLALSQMHVSRLQRRALGKLEVELTGDLG